MAKKEVEVVKEGEKVVCPVSRDVPPKFTELIDTLFLAVRQAGEVAHSLESAYTKAAQEYVRHIERLEIALHALDLVPEERLKDGAYAIDIGQDKTVVTS